MERTDEIDTRPAAGMIDRPIELTRLFIEALNARDVNALATLASADIDLLNPAGGRSLHGVDGLERIVEAAGAADLVFVRRGPEEVSAQDGATRIATPVVERAGASRIHGTALFEIRDGSITAFEVNSELLRR
jgi:hypothetical protein